MKKLLFLTTAAVCLYGAVAQNPPKLNGEVYNPDGIELIYVEGSDSIKGFFIGRYEVTQAQWQSIMGSNPSYFKGDSLPVEMVSWNDVQEFLEKLNEKTGRSYRLPTEIEWRYAAKGGTNNDTCEYAGSNNVEEVAWYWENSDKRTHTVGIKKPNSLGIYDMSGNVWEWCQDLWESPYHVYRGGSWGDKALHCRVAFGSTVTLDSHYLTYVGFRVVLP